MKLLKQKLKDKKYICFLDLEGTQFSHEMIALGAVLATLDKNLHIKRLKPGIHIYVKAKNKIGSYIEKLTNISEETLKEKGVSFYKAMSDLREYCGSAFKKCIFMTFGDHDMKIINSSVQYNLAYPKDVIEQIHHNYMDYAAFISDFIRDENNNVLSLINYCKHFNIPFEGEQHNPLYDALNLAKLYDAFLDNKDIVLHDYLIRLAHYPHLPTPIKKAMEKLSIGHDVDYDSFLKDIRDYLT